VVAQAGRHRLFLGIRPDQCLELLEARGLVLLAAGIGGFPWRISDYLLNTDSQAALRLRVTAPALP